MQAVSLDATLEAEYKDMEKLLDVAPDEAIDKIAKKVIELQKRASGGK